MTRPGLSLVRIGSRGSPLALWQANWVKARLNDHGFSVEIEVIHTTGDRIQNMLLSEAGGTKALFVKEIEEALLDGRVDVAVHSLKDVPAEIPEGLVLAAIPEREDPRDVLIGRIEAGARVGTSSLRRAAQLRARFPGLTIEPLRGNLDTRMKRLDEGKWDGIVVAAAGLSRLGIPVGEPPRIARYLSVEEMCPAIGQGALAIEVRAGEQRADFLEHPATRAAIAAERTVMRVLGGGCKLPVGAHAWMVAGMLGMRALVASPDGGRIVETFDAGRAGETPEELGHRVSEELLAKGAKSILAEVR
jgi:hydroxymethylbilane synthase